MLGITNTNANTNKNTNTNTNRYINRDDMEAALKSMVLLLLSPSLLLSLLLLSFYHCKDGKIIDGSEVKITEADSRPKVIVSPSYHYHYHYCYY